MDFRLCIWSLLDQYDFPLASSLEVTFHLLHYYVNYFRFLLANVIMIWKRMSAVERAYHSLLLFLFLGRQQPFILLLH